MQDRVQKTKDEVQKAAEKYEQSLQEINKYNPVYMEDMTSVFIKCQEMEETRLRFFKSVLFDIHRSLNFSKDPTLPQIYEEFYHTINNADHQKDLKWWSNNHGVNMAMNWPAFVVSRSTPKGFLLCQQNILFLFVCFNVKLYFSNVYDTNFSNLLDDCSTCKFWCY